MFEIWRSEALRQALVAAICVGGGFALGYPMSGLLAFLSLALLWNLIQATRLVRWLDSAKLTDVPRSTGLWGEIFEGIHDLRRRNRKRKKRLASIVSEFQASTAALPDAAIVINHDSEIVWFNNAAETLFGLRSPRDTGRKIDAVVPGDAFAHYLETIDDNEAGERAIQIASPQDAAATLSIRIVPYGNRQRLLIGRDISHVQRLEQTRRDFVANASHELRTPLTVMRGYVDLLLSEMDADEESELNDWAQPLAEMATQSARMEQIIADLLKLARLESNTLDISSEPVDVETLLTELEEEARELSAGRHELAFFVEPELNIRGRSGEIYSAFSNLVFNALRYTPDGGTVNVHWAQDADGAHFVVEDTGPGISEADLPRITERFYRADVARSRETGGTGLGLSIVKHATERQGGQLNIRSVLGQGSRFSCDFPPGRIVLEDALAAELSADFGYASAED